GVGGSGSDARIRHTQTLSAAIAGCLVPDSRRMLRPAPCAWSDFRLCRGARIVEGSEYRIPLREGCEVTYRAENYETLGALPRIDRMRKGSQWTVRPPRLQPPHGRSFSKSCAICAKGWSRYTIRRLHPPSTTSTCIPMIWIACAGFCRA